MNLVYLAHTKERIWRDAAFSIMTVIDYLGIPGTTYDIWVFTDNPGYFDIPGIRTVVIDKTNLEEWYGDKEFIHRSKIKVLQEVMSQTNKPVIMLDGDTLVIEDPSHVFGLINEKHSLMHKLEGPIKNQDNKMGRSLQSLAKSGRIEELSLETNMYNSGVVGIDPSNFQLEKEVLSLTDKLYAASPLHIMEQLAQSIILSTNHTVIDTGEYIYHWWGRGLNVEPILIQYFEETKRMDLAEKLKRLPNYKDQVLATDFNPKLSLIDKLRRKFGN